MTTRPNQQLNHAPTLTPEEPHPNQYDFHLNQAHTLRVIGDVYASEGSYWQAESYFAASQNEWIAARNVQLC